MELTDLPSFSLLDVLEHLPLFELCAISNTCRRLRELAVSVAKRRYRYIDYERFMYEHQNFRKARCNITFREALRFVGPHVERLRFDGNFLKRIKSKHASVPVADTNYEQLYEHQPAITVELKHFARFDTLLPFIDQYFTQLRFVILVYEPTFGCVSPPKVEAAVDETWKIRRLGDGRTLESLGFHVDDTRLGALFQVWPATELLVRCPDLEKVPTGGGGAGGGGSEWSGFRGRCLCELTEVRRLELRYCNKVQVQHFQQFLISNAAHLRTLVLNECAQLNGSEIVVRDIALHLAQLRHLELHFLDVCPPLGKLTELRELSVLHLTMASDCERLLEDLAMNDTLDELHVTDCLVDFSSPGFAGAEFFTHLQAVTLHGNVVGSRMLKRFANEQRLQVMRFTFVAGMAEGLVEVVEMAARLAELDMYCTEWPDAETMLRVVGVLELMKEKREAAGSRGPLRLTLTLEIYDEKDRTRWEEVVGELQAISERYAHLIQISIV